MDDSIRVRPHHLLIKILQTYQDKKEDQLFVGELKLFLEHLCLRSKGKYFTKDRGSWLRNALLQGEADGTIARLSNGRVLTTPAGALISDRVSIPDDLRILIEALVEDY